jgi:hypothetical protein
MPRPRKIAQEESKISEVVEVQDEVAITEVEVPTVELEVSEPEVFAVEETFSPTVFKVYHLGNYVADVEENSDQLNVCLEANKVQLYDNIDKLKTPTFDQEDLVLFNVPATDNRKYNSLAQYFQQNGLAPQSPKINDWMTYYKIKYPLATEEEIAIQVFGPLDYSFEIA